MSSAMTTGAGARKPRGVFALVLVAALWSAFVLSAGAASQLRVAHAAGKSVTRAVSSQPRAPRLRVVQRSSPLLDTSSSRRSWGRRRTGRRSSTGRADRFGSIPAARPPTSASRATLASPC